MILDQYPELRQLDTAKKLQLVSELWDDLAINAEEIPLSTEQKAEVDRRMEEYHRDPTKVTTWEEVQARIRGQKARE